MKVFLLGGYDRSLINFRGPLIRDIVGRGHEVIAAAPPENESVAGDLKQLGATFRPVPFLRTGTSPHGDLALLLRIRRALDECRPDLFLAYTVKPIVYGSIAARAARVPRIVSIVTGTGYAFASGSFRSRMLGGVVRGLYRQAMKFNELAFFQNPDDLASFIDRGYVNPNRAVRTNGSGVDLDHFRRAAMPEDDHSFLLIARLLRDKGILEYVEAARRVKRSHPRVQFHLVGPIDPNPKGFSADEVRRWHDEGTIRYHGFTEDVRPFLRQCSVFVLPSYYPEGLPRTLLEAMAVGRPIITTDSVGCREAVALNDQAAKRRGENVVAGSNGFLVQPRNGAALAEAMEALIANPRQMHRMADASAELAQQRYDAKVVNRLMLDRLGL